MLESRSKFVMGFVANKKKNNLVRCYLSVKCDLNDSVRSLTQKARSVGFTLTRSVVERKSTPLHRKAAFFCRRALRVTLKSAQKRQLLQQQPLQYLCSRHAG